MDYSKKEIGACEFSLTTEFYEANKAQEEEIEQKIKESGPLVSSIIPISTLATDFDGHDVYLIKLKILKERYTGIRRLRRDGNCFYRAFGFAYLEYLLKGKHKNETEKFLVNCEKCKDTLIANNYTEFTVQDFHDQFTEMVTELILNDGQLSDLETQFNNPPYSDYYVVFLRLLVSSYMQRHIDYYSNFIPGEKTVRSFCETEVEPMGLECDNVQVAALALSVGVPICIENCQQSGELNQILFPSGASESSLSSSPPITLLYRPGHYDILYV